MSTLGFQGFNTIQTPSSHLLLTKVPNCRYPMCWESKEASSARKTGLANVPWASFATSSLVKMPMRRTNPPSGLFTRNGVKIGCLPQNVLILGMSYSLGISKELISDYYNFESRFIKTTLLSVHSQLTPSELCPLHRQPFQPIWDAMSFYYRYGFSNIQQHVSHL